MSEFIEVTIDPEKCVGIKECGRCIQVCPVNIFDQQNDRPLIVRENEDECTLCYLCLQACAPHAISIVKRYESA